MLYLRITSVARRYDTSHNTPARIRTGYLLLDRPVPNAQQEHQKIKKGYGNNPLAGNNASFPQTPLAGVGPAACQSQNRLCPYAHQGLRCMLYLRKTSVAPPAIPHPDSNRPPAPDRMMRQLT